MNFIKKTIPEWLTTFGVGILSWMDIYSKTSSWVFIPAVCLLAAGIIFGFVRAFLEEKKLETKHSLEAKVRALTEAIESGSRNYYEIWDDKTRDIYRALDLNIKMRLSIYKHDTTDDTFRLLGRYSDNSQFKIRGRPSYPINEGAIGLARAEGEHFCKVLPNPKTNFNRYCEESEKRYSLSREVIKTMQMKPCCIYAKNIKDKNGTPIAMIVVESSKRESINCNFIQKSIDETHEQAIQEMIDSLKFAEPSLKIARGLRI